MALNCLQNNTDVNNCVDLYRFANTHDSYALLYTARTYVLRNFRHVYASHAFMKLSHVEVHDILCDDELYIDDESIVFNAVINWIKHDKPNRKQYCQELLKDVRMTLIKADPMKELLLSLEELKNGALLSQCALTLNGTAIESEVKLRIGMYEKEMMIFAGGSQSKSSRSLSCYDPETRRNYFAVQPYVTFDYKYRIDHHRLLITDDNDMFLIGGIFFDDYRFEDSDHTALNEVRWFDPFERTWVHKAPMRQSRCAHAAVFCKGSIYAIGGIGKFGDEPLSTVETYDVVDDNWSYVTSLPHGLAHHNAVVYDDHIYTVGGTNGAHVIGTVYQFSTSAWNWSRVMSLERPRAEFAMTLRDDVIYVIGGHDDNQKLCEVELLNMQTKMSQFGPEFPEARKGMAAVTLHGIVYVCGGTRTIISRVNRAPRVVDARDLWRLNSEGSAWQKEVKVVQYANHFGCAVGKMNLRRISESAFVSSAGTSN